MEEEIRAYDASTVKYFLLAAFSLLIGTVQGVIQILPPVHAWILATGLAGAWIDPLAHTHITLVGGVTTALMGTFYYLLPRAARRPIYSMRLADGSFWFSFTGAYLFYAFLMALGLTEGFYMQAGHTYLAAMARYSWLNVGVIFGAIGMGIGYWSFIGNVFLTVWGRRANQRAAAVSAEREVR
ncbi:MAG: cbb3-type cytochrome c oxidase subunit I [Thermaerobacter sp.]|nr:cbb3-type cytochrome c oxidase subunit I [Thermaerobacter sp.]